jgi:hypothetical protein
MEARPTGTANVARTSEGRCGGAIARTEIYMSLPLPLKQNESHPHRLPTNSPYHQLRIPSPESIQVSLAYLTALHCHSDTITMHSTEFKNWVTALVVGIPASHDIRSRRRLQTTQADETPRRCGERRRREH